MHVLHLFSKFPCASSSIESYCSPFFLAPLPLWSRHSHLGSHAPHPPKSTPLAVGGGWRLAGSGGWWSLGRSLTKKIWFLQDRPDHVQTGAKWWPFAVPWQHWAMQCPGCPLPSVPSAAGIMKCRRCHSQSGLCWSVGAARGTQRELCPFGASPPPPPSPGDEQCPGPCLSFDQFDGPCQASEGFVLFLGGGCHRG